MVSVRKNLFEACVETFSQWTVQYYQEYGTAVEHAIIADPSPNSKHLIVAIRDSETFPPHARELEQLTLYDTLHFQGNSDEGITYPVIGVIEECTLHLNCGEEYFKTFFTSTGQLLGTVTVNDLVKTKREERKKVYSKQKRDARKEKRETSPHLQCWVSKDSRWTNASTVASDNVDLAANAEAEATKARKREKRRAKEARQKERRNAAAKEADNMHKAARAKIQEELQATVKSMGFHEDARIIDPTTNEGREELAIAKEMGWNVQEIHYQCE